MGEKNGSMGMNRKGPRPGGQRRKTMGGKEGCKISLPQCAAKTGKFSEIYFLRAHQTETLDFRGCWYAVNDTTENRGLLPTTSFNNARTICFKSVILRITYYSYKCYSCSFGSSGIYIATAVLSGAVSTFSYN